MYTSFLAAVPAVIANDPGLSEALTSRLEPLELSKGEVILSPGEVCQACYFVNQGSLYQSHWDATGIERVGQLFGPHDWVLDHPSFTGQKPAVKHITALEPTHVFKLGIHHIHHLIAENPVFFSLGRILENVIADERLTANHIKPEDKYSLLLERHPQWLQQFPLKLIASFMGITPETLSRVRRKINA